MLCFLFIVLLFFLTFNFLTLLSRLLPSPGLYSHTEIAPLDRIVGRTNLYLVHSVFQTTLPASLQQFFHGQALLFTLLLCIVLLAD